MNKKLWKKYYYSKKHVEKYLKIGKRTDILKKDTYEQK